MVFPALAASHILIGDAIKKKHAGRTLGAHLSPPGGKN